MVSKQKEIKVKKMNNQEMNLELVRLLNKWDPFQIGEGNYDTEIADCIQVIHDLDNAEELAMKIQAIYEFSFEEYIPVEKCLTVARQLLSIKDSGSCSI